MTKDTYTIGFATRLREAAKKCEFNSPQQLAKAISSAGFDLSYTSVYKHWEGINYPGAEHLIAYAKVLSVNLHNLITGEEPPKPDLNDIRRMVEDAAQAAATKGKDPRLVTINKKWSELTDAQKKLVVQTVEMLTAT
jgi:hypothetical protein